MSDSDDETKPDMTRIEDLSEYLHEEDPETDAQLDTSHLSESEDEPPEFETMSLDDLEDDEASEEEPPSFADDDESDPPSFEASEENNDDSEETSWGDDSGDDNEWGSEESDFSSDSTQPDIEIPAEFAGGDDTDELDEVQDIEEEAQLQEEVENEIQEAMDEDDNDSFDGGFEDSGDFGGETAEFGEEDSDSSFDEPSDDEEQDEGTDALVAAAVDDIVSDEAEEVEQELAAEPEPEVVSEPEPEPEVAPVIEAAPEVYDSPAPSEERSTPRENFQDINDFGNAISYGNVAAGGNPPFSIILRRIKYLEDSERIIEILREHGLCDDTSEADYRQGLNNGSMLISQLSEYSAIYLAHKFRRFDLEILVGLADEIHPSKNYDMDYKGLVRKQNLRQNKSETMSLEDQIVEVESILLATTPTLENYKIDRYLGVVSTHVMIDEKEFQKLQEVDTGMNTDPDELLQEIELELAEETETSKTAHVEIGLEEIYQNLAEALKIKAYKLKGNAVVGINYQITPLINQKPGESTPAIRYKISCTGNAVWVGGKEAPRSEA